jgi:hypothetical protein
MPYCPYTDRDLDLADTSPEHIVPLSLGGVGAFQIPVCKAANSEVGSRIDGAMSRDFLTMTQRDRYDVRGHSNKEPVFVAKHCSDPAGKPLQVVLGQRTGLQVWSPRDKEYIRDERAKTINITFSIEKDLPSQFVAKVALSAGYFAYGEVFRKQVKHSEFRTIMNYNPANINIDEIRGLEALGDDRFSDTQSEQLQLFRVMCKAAEPNSLVALLPGPDRFAAFVGILGDYVGMINVPATTAGFPNEGAFRGGHVMVPQKGSGLARLSFQDALMKLADLPPPLKP